MTVKKKTEQTKRLLTITDYLHVASTNHFNFQVLFLLTQRVTAFLITETGIMTKKEKKNKKEIGNHATIS